MRLPFSPEFGPFLGEVILDVEIYSERGGDRLVINDVLDGKFSLLHDAEKLDDERLGKLLKDAGYLIADMAERSPKLLADAVAQASYERAA